MKTLQSITIGPYQIAASAEHAGGHVLAVTVRCGDQSLTGNMTDQGTHDRTEEAFEKSVTDFARRLAEELAGKLRSEELARKFAAG